HVDHADKQVFAVQERQQIQRHVRVDAFQRDLADPAFGKRREKLLVLPPLFAKRILPVDVGLDTVAVADVHGGLALEPVNGTVHRLDTPPGDVVHEHVESRLIELNNVN